MFGRNKNKDKSVGFNVYGDVDKLHPLLDKEMKKVNEKLPDAMDKKIEQVKKKLPGRIKRNLNSLYMFMEALKREDHVRIQVMDSDNVRLPLATRVMFKTMMGEAKKITRDFLKDQGIMDVKIK